MPSLRRGHTWLIKFAVFGKTYGLLEEIFARYLHDANQRCQEALLEKKKQHLHVSYWSGVPEKMNFIHVYAPTDIDERPRFCYDLLRIK